MSRYIERRLAVSWLIVTLLLTAGFGEAQSGLVLTPLTPASEVLPRQTVNLVLSVANNGNERWTGSVTPDLPPGWRLLVPGADTILEPGESATQLITLLIPRDAEAGAYSIRVRGGESGEAEFLLTVKAVTDLEVTALDAPQMVVAANYSATFSIRNSGNANTEIQVLPRDNLNLRLATSIAGRPYDESAGVVLRAGESVIVEVLVHVPADLTNLESHRLTLNVRSLDVEGLAANAEVHVDLIPNETDLSAAFHSFPLRLRAIAALDLHHLRERPDEALKQGVVEISGEGKLWDSQPGTVRVELGTGINSADTEALIAYQLDSFRLALGRQKSASSPLLPVLEGVGAQVFGEVWPVDSVRLAGEAYSLADDDQRHYGLGLGMALEEAFRGGVRLRVGEEDSHFGTRWQVLPGPVSASVSGGAAQEVDVEYVRRWTVTGEGGSAIRLGAGIKSAPLEASVSFRARESGYDDSSSDSTSVMVDAQGKLATSFSSSFRATARLDVDYPAGALRGGTRDIEGYDSRIALELSGEFADADLGLAYVHEQAAEYGASPFSSSEDEYGISLATSPDPVSQFRQRLGFLRTADSIFPDPHFSYLYLAGLRTSYGGGELTSEVDLAYSRKQREFTRLVLSSEWTGKISPNLGLLAGVDWGLVGDRIAHLEAKWDYHPAPARKLAVGLRGDFYASRGARFRLDLALTEAFQLQLGPLSTVGRVSGRVTDSNGNPRKRLVIRLAGRSSVTDEEGRFLFPAVPEGRHKLSIHPDSLARNELTVPATPMPVQVNAQSEIGQDLMLVEGARLSGTITYRAPEAGGTEWERALPVEGPGALDGIELTLTNGQTTVRTLSDARGNFDVARLTPGEWRLIVESERLSPSYLFAPVEQILHLESGPNQAVIELRPKERAIRFIDGGVIDEEGTPTEETGR